VKRSDSEALRCSFCHKSQDVVGKLISSPSDYPEPTSATSASRFVTRFWKTTRPNPARHSPTGSLSRRK